MDKSSSCTEIYLEDVVAIDIYRDADVKTPLPRFVPNVLHLAGVQFGTPLLHFAYSIDGSAANEKEIDTAPTLKVTDKLDVTGRVFTHELTVSVQGDLYNIREVQRSLGADDCAVVYTKGDGSRQASLPLYNTAKLEIEQNVGGTSNVKVSLTSMSPLVNLM